MSLKAEVDKAWTNVISPLFEEFSTEILVQSVDVGATDVDPVYDEPVSTKVFTDPVAIRARIKLAKEQMVLPGGEFIEIDGKVTVRSSELESNGIDLEIGARITFQNARYTVVHRAARAEVADNFLLTKVAIQKEE